MFRQAEGFTYVISLMSFATRRSKRTSGVMEKKITSANTALDKSKVRIVLHACTRDHTFDAPLSLLSLLSLFSLSSLSLCARVCVNDSALQLCPFLPQANLIRLQRVMEKEEQALTM